MYTTKIFPRRVQETTYFQVVPYKAVQAATWAALLIPILTCILLAKLIIL